MKVSTHQLFSKINTVINRIILLIINIAKQFFSEYFRLEHKENVAERKGEYEKVKHILMRRIQILEKSRYLDHDLNFPFIFGKSSKKYEKEILLSKIRYYQYFGSFVDALKWRNKYHNFNILNISQKKQHLTEKLRSYVEKNQGQAIINELQSLVDNDLSKSCLFLEFLTLALDLSQQPTAAQNLREHYLYNISDRIYATSLKGKRVALIGPLIDYEKEELARLEYEHDYIIVLNLKLEQFKRAAFRIDASYYSIRLKEEEIVDIENLSRYLDSVSFFWKKGADLFKFRDFSKNCRLRQMRNPRHLLHNKYIPNMLQNAVYDILYLHPKSIKIYGFNAYLGKKPYVDNYENSKMAVSWAPYGMRIHEPFSNFSFIHALLSSGLIDVDPIGEVFRKSVDDYAVELDALFAAETLDKWKAHKSDLL